MLAELLSGIGLMLWIGITLFVVRKGIDVFMETEDAVDLIAIPTVGFLIGVIVFVLFSIPIITKL